MKCKIENVNFLATHLDHKSEDVRMEQLDIIKDLFYDIDIFIGDLNSLHYEDYSSKMITEINKNRQMANLKEAEFDCTNFLKNYFTIYTNFIQYTTNYKTRIDYILLNKRKNIISYNVLNTLNKYSDHNIVIAEIF